jgi:hypothetical protein
MLRYSLFVPCLVEAIPSGYTRKEGALLIIHLYLIVYMLFIRERISSHLFDVIAYLRRMDNELYVYTATYQKKKKLFVYTAVF